MIYDRRESEKKDDNNIYDVALIARNSYNPPILSACGTQNNRRRQIGSCACNISRDNGPPKRVGNYQLHETAFK